MITIAIDGPSAAGKSATAKMIADKLNILHLNTGALYRAVGVYFLQNNLDAKNEELVNSHLNNINIKIEFKNKQQTTILNGIDISDKLYTPVMSDIASRVSSYQKVREKMLDVQQEIGRTKSVIMEGRDITYNILPNAKYKFFLTASAEKRAERRHKNFIDQGENITYEEVLLDLKERDNRDTSRELFPLKITEDSVVINNDNKSLEEVVELILSYIK